MKILIFTTALIIALLCSAGCNKPAPTELVTDDNFDDPLQIEVMAKDTLDEYYSSGYDTTGVVENIHRFTNLIIASGVKVTYKGITSESSLAQAIFFDKNFPFYAPSGRLLGYRTRTPGDVEFDNHKARRVLMTVKFRRGNFIADTTLGFKYVLFNKTTMPGDPFIFPYNSTIDFSYKPIIGQASGFQITTPAAVNAAAKLSGDSSNNSLEVNLTWNKSPLPEIEIVIGVMKPGRWESLPLYKIKTRDDGSLKIPVKLLSKISRSRFDRLVFTITRRYENNHNSSNIDLYVISQSTHTIVADIP